MYASTLSISTAQKLIKASRTLDIPIYSTTQHASRLGPTVAELTSLNIPPSIDKTAFSMIVPDLLSEINKNHPEKTHSPRNIAIVGIESHICVTQTTLDLLAQGHKVYVIADGVSSCNEHERTVALRRLAREGAVVTTSESWIYEVMGDATIDG